jgi:hypothetical protein
MPYRIWCNGTEQKSVQGWTAFSPFSLYIVTQISVWHPPPGHIHGRYDCSGRDENV